jgi:hypothetical protein
VGPPGPAGQDGAQGPQGIQGPPGHDGAGVPNGGTTGQVLGKASNANQDVIWLNQVGGLTLPLGQHLTFAPDGTYDVGGSSSAQRPRNGYFTGAVTVAGSATSLTLGAVGLNAFLLPAVSGNLLIGTGGSERMRIRTDGHIGVNDPGDPAITFRIKTDSSNTGYGYQHVDATPDNVFYTRNDGLVFVKGPLNLTTSILLGNGATIGQYTNGSDVRVSISGLTVAPGPTATAALAVNGALTINADTHVAGHGFYLDSPGSTLYLGNQTIQFVQTLYGLNNTCYITNDGSRWTTSAGLTVSADLAVSTTYAQGGITMTLNSGAANPYAIISTGGGDLYIRSNSGNVRLDSGSIWAPSCVISTLYINSSVAAPYIQNAGAAIRYYAAGVHSFEGSGTVNCTILNFTSSINSNGAVWRSDGVQNIVTLPPSGSQHWFMTNGQAGWATCYAAAFTPQSARKFKTDIRVLEDALSIVLDERVHGVRYTERGTDEHLVGFIADDWLGVLPEVVALDNDGDVFGIDYDHLTAVTFEALKQHAIATNKRLKALEARLAA